MKRNKFYYTINVLVSITGHELSRLMALSDQHYDAKCKSAGQRATPQTAGRWPNGLLYGLCMQWSMHDPHPEKLEAAFQSIVTGEGEGLDRAIEVTLASSDVDLLAKIGEGENGLVRRSGLKGQRQHFHLTDQFARMLRECNAEHERLNPREE